jgi:hypothetical protein
MPAQIKSVPESKVFRLELLDARQDIPDEEQSTVEIITSTFSGNSKRSQEFSKFKVERDGDKEITYYDWSYYKLVLTEIYLTMIACNLTNGKEPLFKFKEGRRGSKLAMTFEDFADALGLMDDDAVIEIHSKVLEMNPQWIVGGRVEDIDLGEES